MFTQTNETIVWQHIRQSRIALLAYLETLSDEDWDVQSLCDGWRVRDVIGHLILEYHYNPSNSWIDFTRSGFSINTFMKQTAITLGNSPIPDLLQRFRLIIDEQCKPGSVSTLNVLVDLLIHEQDIRIPLHNPKDMDMGSLTLVFVHWEPGEYNFGERITGLAARLKGLKFTIVDLNLSKGEGLAVIGSAQDILLAAAGRSMTLPMLSGEGLAILKLRLR